MASYQCDRCLKRFSSYYNVRRHKANHCAYAKIDDNASMEGGGSSYSDEQSVDSFPDEESVTETEEDENSENSEDDGEIKEEIDPWATMIDDAKATVRPEYDEFMKTLQMAWMGKKKVQLSRKPLKTFSLNFRKNSLTFTWIIYDG